MIIFSCNKPILTSDKTIYCKGENVVVLLLSYELLADGYIPMLFTKSNCNNLDFKQW